MRITLLGHHAHKIEQQTTPQDVFEGRKDFDKTAFSGVFSPTPPSPTLYRPSIAFEEKPQLTKKRDKDISATICT